MTGWVLAALAGGALSLAGFVSLVGQYRRGEIRGRHLAAFGVGSAGLVAFALLNALQPGGGGLALLVLLPTFVAIVVIVTERRRQNGGRR